ncbi:MAG: hypothetical protein V4606_05025 [Patescibacteria group bacterium]
MTQSEVNVSDLVSAHEDLFYQQKASNFSHQVFTERRFLNRQIVNDYTKAFEAQRLDFGRSHNMPEDKILNPTFPLLETMAWWIAYTRSREVGHGMRSYVTPTSTYIEGHRLGVALLVNECLRVAYTFVAREVVSPHNQIWPAITW